MLLHVALILWKIQVDPIDDLIEAVIVDLTEDLIEDPKGDLIEDLIADLIEDLIDDLIEDLIEDLILFSLNPSDVYTADRRCALSENELVEFRGQSAKQTDLGRLSARRVALDLPATREV